MCRTRRIKVRLPQISSALLSVFSFRPLSHRSFTNVPLHSVMKENQHAHNVQSPGDNVLATRTTLTSSSATKRKPPRRELRSLPQNQGGLPPNKASYHPNGGRPIFQRPARAKAPSTFNTSQASSHNKRSSNQQHQHGSPTPSRSLLTRLPRTSSSPTSSPFPPATKTPVAS